MNIFKGIIAPAPTPFGDSGGIAPEKVEPLVAYLTANGLKGFFVMGTWGSFPMLSTDERKLIAEAFCKAAHKHSVSAVIQVGSTSSTEACELARHAADCGADAIASTIPFYYASAGFYDIDVYKRYFASLIEAAGQCPTMLYNNPRTTGVLLSPREFVDLCQVGIKGLKDGSMSAAWLAEAIDLLDEEGLECEIMPGNTCALLYGLAYGVNAIISGTSVATPRLAANVHEAWQAGRHDEAAALHRKLLKIQRTISKVGKPPVLSYGLLRHAGVDIGDPRQPWRAVAPEKIKSLWEELEIILSAS